VCHSGPRGAIGGGDNWYNYVSCSKRVGRFDEEVAASVDPLGVGRVVAEGSGPPGRRADSPRIVS
jgi:hypothetical protein